MEEINYKAGIEYHLRQYDVQYSSTKLIIELLKKNLPVNEKINILDIGCGGGANIFWLKKEFPNWNFVGIDFDESCISLAKIKNPEFDFYAEDLNNISSFFKSKEFDYALALQFLITAPFSPDQLFNLVIPHVKKGIFLSSLFSEGYIEQNTVRRDLKTNQTYCYNIFSLAKISDWSIEKLYTLKYEAFEIDIDLPKPEDDVLQTYTLTTKEGGRIQLSSYMILPWYNVFLKL